LGIGVQLVSGKLSQDYGHGVGAKAGNAEQQVPLYLFRNNLLRRREAALQLADGGEQLPHQYGVACDALLCVDLFTKEVWTLSGLRTAYVLFVLHLGTRRILLAEATFSPTGLWMGQMARNLLMSCEDLGVTPGYILHDRDKLLAWDFDAVLTTAHSKVVKTPFRTPDANAHAERWVGSVTGECLDHLILFGMSSLRRALRIYRDFFNDHRPHQGIGNRIPRRRASGEMSRDCAGAMTDGDLAVECEQFLGGLLNSYYRKVA